MERFEALADPTRREIVELLCRAECASGDIADKFAMSAPAVSQHLKVLKEAKLVRVRVEGQKRIYSIDPQGLAEMEDWLSRMRGFWQNRLDALEQALRKPAKQTKGRRK